MKLLRYGPAGHEQPGILDANGRIRSLAGTLTDLTPQHLSPTSLKRLVAIDPGTPIDEDGDARHDRCLSRVRPKKRVLPKLALGSTLHFHLTSRDGRPGSIYNG